MGRSSRSATAQAQQDSDHDNSDNPKTVKTWDGTPLGKPSFYISDDVGRSAQMNKTPCDDPSAVHRMCPNAE